MSILLAVVTAVAAVTLTTYFSTKSAFALGKVSAMVSATAVLADAWGKMQTISKRLADNPTAVMLPSVTPAATSTSREVARREEEENDFYNENPSFLTGGIRGYSAYRRP